jgi:hypothetical protein
MLPPGMCAFVSTSMKKYIIKISKKSLKIKMEFPVFLEKELL